MPLSQNDLECVTLDFFHHCVPKVNFIESYELSCISLNFLETE